MTNTAPFSAMRHRDFRIFWLGLVISGIGTQFSTVAMAWQIYELTNSPLHIGLIGLARAVPNIGLLLFGGLLADAVDRSAPGLRGGPPSPTLPRSPYF